MAKRREYTKGEEGRRRGTNGEEGKKRFMSTVIPEELYTLPKPI